MKMLMNEFDLKLDKDDEFLQDKPNEKEFFLNSKFYWLSVRDTVKTGLKIHIVLLMNRHQKGIYRISPNYTIVIK